MRSLIRHAAVVTCAAVMWLIPAAGVGRLGRGPVLIWSPTPSAGTYNFGTLDAGQTVSQTVPLPNSGGAATAALSITMTGSSAFTKIGNTCNQVKLKANTSCNVTVQYAPPLP